MPRAAIRRILVRGPAIKGTSPASPHKHTRYAKGEGGRQRPDEDELRRIEAQLRGEDVPTKAEASSRAYTRRKRAIKHAAYNNGDRHG